MITTFATATTEKILNRILRLDPQTTERLKKFSGKILLIDMSGWKLKFYMMITDFGIQILNHYEGSADTIIRGSPFALLRISKNIETQFDDVAIEGDIELGQQIRELLRAMDIDWEEHLSKITGDVIAHQVGSVTQKLTNWLKQSSHAVQLDLTEYLQEEARLLPTRIETEEFIEGVSKLRNDIERLEARIASSFQ